MIMERGARPDAPPNPKRSRTALIVVVGVGVALALGLGLGVGLGWGFAVEKVQSKANFYAQTSEGECGLEFTIIPNREGKGTIKGSIAWTDLGLRLRLPEKGFVAVNGKLSQSEAEIFAAMVALKGLAVGFYDGTVLPIDLTGLDPKPFAACVEALPR